MAASGVCEPSDECVQLIRGHDTGNKPSLDGDSVKQSEQPVVLSKRKLKRLKKTEKWEENKLRKRYYYTASRYKLAAVISWLQ